MKTIMRNEYNTRENLAELWAYHFDESGELIDSVRVRYCPVAPWSDRSLLSHLFRLLTLEVER